MMSIKHFSSQRRWDPREGSTRRGCSFSKIQRAKARISGAAPQLYAREDRA